MKTKLKLGLLAAALCCALPLHAQFYDLVVAQDGTGDYTRITDAVEHIRDYKPEGRQRILVKKGVYEEKLIIPSFKTNIALIGEERDSCIIVWHDHGSLPLGDGRNMGTFRSFTLRVDGLGFEAENLTIVNDAMTHYNPTWYYNPETGARNERQNSAKVAQAVTVHVEGDRALFRNCRLLGFQDTVFNGNEDSRQAFYRCYIEGTVDFIFGPATCWFEECELHAISNGYLTAASTPAHHPVGYVFNHCRVTVDSLVTAEWLGRPWRNDAAVTFKECELPAEIRPQGWHNWNDPQRERTARYAEYACTGPGADRSKRAAWTHELTADEAAALTPAQVFARPGHDWTPHLQAPTLLEAAARFYAPAEGRYAAYVGGTLETAVSATPEADTEPLRISLDSVDCTTFVEYVTATLLSGAQPAAGDSIFTRFVQGLRYRDGGRRGNYATRLHYFSDWIADNEAYGAVRELTSALPGAKALRRKINFMTQHRASYPALAASDSLTRAVAAVEARLSAATTYYIPTAQISRLGDAVREGDMVVFVTDTPGLDVQHVGFLIGSGAASTGSAKWGLLHASSRAGHVTTEASLADYAKGLKHCIGVRIVRIETL
jgi:pectin methylesterase-like acyl-CoA thioesterase